MRLEKRVLLLCGCKAFELCCMSCGHTYDLERDCRLHCSNIMLHMEGGVVLAHVVVRELCESHRCEHTSSNQDSKVWLTLKQDKIRGRCAYHAQLLTVEYK